MENMRGYATESHIRTYTTHEHIHTFEFFVLRTCIN